MYGYQFLCDFLFYALSVIFVHKFLFQANFGTVAQKHSFKKFMPESKKVATISKKFQSTMV